jgi:hypothetical protein
MGTVGISKPNCKRVSILISKRLGPILAAFHGLAALILLFEMSSFLKYITEKQHQLFLSDQGLEFLQHHVKLIAVLFIVSAVVEVMRFYMLTRIREDLRLYDVEQRNEMLRSHARSVVATQQQQQQQQRRRQTSRSTRNEMQGPLLSDHEYSKLPRGADEGVALDTSATFTSQPRNKSVDESRVSWWEEPSPENISYNSKNQNKDTRNGGGWISKVLKKPSKNRSSVSDGGNDEELGEEASIVSSVGFAPVDGQMDVGTTPWNDVSDTDDGDDNEKLPDLSWAKEGSDL